MGIDIVAEVLYAIGGHLLALLMIAMIAVNADWAREVLGERA